MDPWVTPDIIPVQFYLGPSRSGAMMHFHNHAVNALAYGRKQWFLMPPSQAVYAKAPRRD